MTEQEREEQRKHKEEWAKKTADEIEQRRYIDNADEAHKHMRGQLEKRTQEAEMQELREACKAPLLHGEPLKVLQPMMIFQPLPSAVDEFIIEVRKLMTEFHGMARSEAVLIVMQLKDGCRPQEVK